MASKKFEAIVASAMIFSACVTVASFVFIFLPYEPLTYHSVSTPEEVCEDDPVGVYVDFSISEEEFSTIRRIDVRSNWVAVDVPGVAAGSKQLAADTPLEPYQFEPGRTTREARTLRTLPQPPGLWLLETEVKVRGSRFWLPVLQEVVVWADEETLVIPEDSETC